MYTKTHIRTYIYIHISQGEIHTYVHIYIHAYINIYMYKYKQLKESKAEIVTLKKKMMELDKELRQKVHKPGSSAPGNRAPQSWATGLLSLGQPGSPVPGNRAPQPRATGLLRQP
jgi:hypothetical protein